MANLEYPLVSLSQHDWSLHQDGSQDAQRHDEKVKEAIRGKLPEIISDGGIITADPTSKRIVKVPLKSLDLPRIVYSDGKEGVGSGEGEVGDVVDVGDRGSETGDKAGDRPGVEYYETEITLEELKRLVFDEMALPYLLPKRRANLQSETFTFDDVRKKRVPSNLDLTRTIYANMERNALAGKRAEISGISPDDFRVRTWQEDVKEENNAVAIFMRDISGSMGDFEIYMSRTFCWWSYSFLKTVYPSVEAVFIAHDTEAYKVDEKKFFERGAGGGTMCSSANELALQIINTQYPVHDNNVYVFHFSDGDNLGDDDNEKCVSSVRKQLELPINQYVYAQIEQGHRISDHGLYTKYRESVSNPRLVLLSLTGKQDIWPGLRAVFDPKKQIA